MPSIQNSKTYFNKMLSIVITNYKQPKLLRDCIESLQKTIKRTHYEIIVVDSESDEEGVKSALKDLGDIKPIIFKENVGYAKAVNAGLKEAVGDYILILNSDIKTTSSAIDDMVDFMNSDAISQKIGMIGPRLYGFDGKIQQTTFRFHTLLTIPLRRTFFGKLPLFKNQLDWFLMKDKNMDTTDLPQPVDWLMGAALLVSKQSLKKVGGIDERFFMYLEDTDWARRFWESGFKVFYFPRAMMYHMHSRASKKFGIIDALFNKMTIIHIKSAILYFIKYKFKTDHYA